MSLWESRAASRSTKAATDRAVRAAAQREPLGRRTAVYGIDHRLSHLDRIAFHRECTGCASLIVRVHL
jgi:hypothetical protein